MPHVVVIGAGLSGLATAFRLRQRPGVTVTCLDASSRAGGNIITRVDDGFTWELGPNGFQDNKPSTLQLCRDLGIEDQLVAASEASRKNRYLCLNGELVKLPGSPEGILTTKALSVQGKLSLVMEPLRRGLSKPGESVHAFAVRRFGREAAETIVDALVTGIHAGDPALLEVATAFPRLVQWEAEAGSVLRGVLRMMRAKKVAARDAGLPKPGPTRLLSFAGGLQVLVDALVKSLDAALSLNCEVMKLEFSDETWHIHTAQRMLTADAVILTTPAHVQSRLLGSVDAALSDQLNAIKYNRVAVVALGYREEHTRTAPDGFGYIAPQRGRRDVLGVQWCSRIYPGRAPAQHVLWRALAGGMHRGDVLDWPDETLIQKVHAEMVQVMKVTGEPVFAKVKRWPKAIPQYEIGHGERVRRCRELAHQHRGLYLAGNAFDGIAMNDCTLQAERLAAEV